MYNVIKTVMTYPLDGSNRDFHIPFEYLARGFVQVTLLGKDRKVLTLNQDYRFTTKTTISTSKPWGASEGYTLIEIRRFTSASDRLVNFEDGSVLRSHDLNLAQIQSMHIAEEARDLTADTIGVNNNGDLDARGRKIINLADGSGTNDAISLKQVREWNDSALNSANAAKAQADRATEQGNYAAKKANDANMHQMSAESYRNEARSSSESARDWAVKTTTVADGHQSARTYSLECRSSETNARNSANSAGQSEKSSLGYRDAASSSASQAKASEERAIAEANKLGNWNALAGTIREIKDGWVSWSNSLKTPNLVSDYIKSTGAIDSGSTVTGDFIAARDSVRVPDAHLAPQGNIHGKLWEGRGGNDLKGFILAGEESIRNDTNNTINQLVSQVKVELGEKIFGLRRGDLQNHYQNNAEDWEAPSGYLTGARNVIQNGNIRYTSWRFRTVQAYSNKLGWVDVA